MVPGFGLSNCNKRQGVGLRDTEEMGWLINVNKLVALVVYREKDVNRKLNT